MAWTTPKTNWQATVTDGVYTGDYFKYTDYNRIKHNIIYLASQPMPNVDIVDMGGDKDLGDPIHSRDFNAFEHNLDLIGKAVGYPYENYPMFSDNGNTPDFIDLNQIENFCLELYDVLSGNFVYAIDAEDQFAVDTEGEFAVAEGEE